MSQERYEANFRQFLIKDRLKRCGVKKHHRHGCVPGPRDYSPTSFSNVVASKNTTGTAAYRAPEIILHEKCERGVDVWAFGIVMYIMLCGSHPFDLRGMV
jgi:serine/threonine protein kinase